MACLMSVDISGIQRDLAGYVGGLMFPCFIQASGRTAQ